MAKTRASVPESDALLRKEHVRASKSNRASEPESVGLHRKEHDRVSKSNKRVLEPESDALLRKEQNKASMATKRASNVLVQDAIAAFHSKSKCGPDFVRTCCHGMMYRASFLARLVMKYLRMSLPKKFKCICFGRQWVCT